MEQLSLEIKGINETILTDRQTDRPPQTLQEKVEKAQKALRLAADMSKTYYKKPLIVTYSGGKDSDVLLHLAESCLTPDEFEVFNSHTTVDAPETVYHIRKVFKRLNNIGVKTTVNYHKNPDGTNKTMWSLIIEKKSPPTRFMRYCCEKLKESSTPNRLCALGVRAAESRNRQGRDIFATRGSKKSSAHFYSLEHAEEVHQESQEIQDENWDCLLIKDMKKNKEIMVNPIYEWLDLDVWSYIKSENIKVNPLYSKGYERVGCIGCPLTSHKKRIKEFIDYPAYKQMYINAFTKMLKIRARNGMEDVTGREGYHCWRTGEDVFAWWMEEYKRIPYGQLSLFEDEKMEAADDTQ